MMMMMMMMMMMLILMMIMMMIMMMMMMMIMIMIMIMMIIITGLMSFLFQWVIIGHFRHYLQQIWLQGSGKWFQREGRKESLLILYWFVFFYKDLVNALLLNHYEVKSIDVKYNLINHCSDLVAFFETMTSRQKFKKLWTKTPIKL